MKYNTSILIIDAIKSGDMIFHDNRPVVTVTSFRLARQLVKSEYGLRTKKNRIVNKKLKTLLTNLLKKVAYYVEENY